MSVGICDVFAEMGIFTDDYRKGFQMAFQQTKNLDEEKETLHRMIEKKERDIKGLDKVRDAAKIIELQEFIIKANKRIEQINRELERGTRLLNAWSDYKLGRIPTMENEDENE